MTDTPISVMPRWKRTALWVLASLTPLRYRRVRTLAFRLGSARVRRRRTAAERRGDWSLSMPALDRNDVRLAELLGDDGFFVEAGANDGFTQSNTYLLERRHGWRGVLIEPVPELAREAQRARPDAMVVQCALGAPEQEGKPITMRFAGLMSIVEGARGNADADHAWIDGAFVRGAADSYEIDVPCRTLGAVLDEAGAPEVDLLSLDLEGFEPPALEGLGAHRPRWILVEAHGPDARAAVEAALGDDYIHVERFSGNDELYRRADVAPR